ncbi:benzoate-CoA ligase family protein [Yinghuangia seranimata]|uniref:benzoate-CoA ligase family protein n=1 Tax=Yinghuangia seranimata TaxID=408067 RepID=UPI00248C0674|nr:benzoate-CoA ligase family protein [Yinghuangia seranimata]MDI2130050.1 benzoate-CoA ligase family protein [Yinghuangia seranimata]
MPEPFNAASYLVDRQISAGHADRTAVAGPRGTLTYGELGDRIRRVAAGLRANGLRPEERVMLFASDGPELLVAILAAMRAGAVPVPVSTMYRGHELAELLRDSRARLLLVTPEFAEAADEAVRNTPDLAGVVVVDDAAVDPPGHVARIAWASLFDHGEDAEPYPTHGDSPALWLYTSGTTGTPKAAMHRHANIRHVVETYGEQVLGTTPDDRCFSVAKLFFAYGLGNAAFFPLAAGATAVLDPARPSPAGVAARLAADRPTLFFAGPTFFAALLHSPDVPRDAFASVRFAVSAGEALPAELYARFLERFGVEIVDGIGSTEALHIFLSNRPGEVRPGTTGTAVPGYELRLRDAEGRDVPDGEPGNLFLRGPSLATGYWARTDTTRAVFQGEWLATGDIYSRDADGYYRCLGRGNDMIKAGGIWVSPAEVEARLLTHPSVAQVAVVAATDTDGLEKPVACVVAAPGHTVEPDELVAYCREGLAAFKRPRHVIAFDVLPTTATGKLQRYVLRQEVAVRLKQHAPRTTHDAEED